jgi:site-specific recombinase XerD
MLRLQDYITAFESDLAARNRSPQTVTTYLLAVNQFLTWLEESGRSMVAAQITPNDVRSWLGHLHERVAPATVAQRFRSLQQFLKFVVEEGDSGLETSPMARLKPPSVPEKPIPILAEEDLRALLGACGGTRFDDRRDTALVRMFIDTGARLSEIANARTADLDLPERALHVVTKGRHEKVKYFGPRTSLALDRYLRVRKERTYADSEWLWIGKRGRLNPTGVRQVLQRRAEQAGLGHVHPHQFRHTFAHRWLAAGNHEGELMRLMGWKSRQMIDRYGASAADERARESYRRFAMESGL